MNEWVGIPYSSGGRDPAKGLDCLGLVLAYFESDYDGLFGYLEPVEYRVRKQDDVIVFSRRGCIEHIGVVFDRTRMLHCRQDCGTVIEEYHTPRWKPRIGGIYRVPF